MVKSNFVTIREAQYIASKKIRKGTMEWLESGAEDDLTVKKNIQALDDIQIYPRILKKITKPNLNVNFLNKEYKSPIIISPMGHQTQFHKDGEIETAKGTSLSEIITSFTTQGRINLKNIKSQSENKNLIWQFFLFGDKNWILEQIKLAESNNCLAISICLDAPVRSFRYLDRESRYDARKYGRRNLKSSPDITMALKYDYSIIKWIRKQTKLPIIPKGVVYYKDSLQLMDLGVDAIWLSNHGGRMFNSGISGIEILEDHKRHIKTKIPYIVDGGVRRGSDIMKYISLGADMVGIGRPALYGLIANGKKGVNSIINIFHEELKISMTNAGFKTISDIRNANLR